jgi:hypothetical protein
MKTINFMCSKSEAEFYSNNIGMNSLVSLNGVNCSIVIKSVNENLVTAEMKDQEFNVLNQLNKN